MQCSLHCIKQLLAHLEKLLYESILAGTSPDDGIILVGQQEADGHDPEVLIHKHR